jgi:RNA polymerase sigma-70 factor (ECF subfamily)
MNDASETDASLVAGALAGNLDAFAALVHRYRDSYTRFAVRMLGDLADAEDVLQSVWMRAFRDRRAGESNNSPLPIPIA